MRSTRRSRASRPQFVIGACDGQLTFLSVHGSIVAMRRVVRLLPIGTLALYTGGCAPPNVGTPYPATPPEEGTPTIAAPPSDEVRFLDRTIQLQPFLAGFPYGSFDVDLEHGVMFFVEKGDAYTLRALTLPEGDALLRPLDVKKARAVSEVDWSTRSLWGGRWHAKTNTLWLHADEKNDERMNLWTLSMDDGALAQVTDADYVYSFGFSRDQRLLAYLPRTGQKAPYATCLRVRDLERDEDREIVCDTPALTFTWSSMVFSPDGTRVYFNAQVEGDRTRVQLVEVDLMARKPTVRMVTDPEVARSSPSALRTWVDGELLFLANDDGYRNLYAYNPEARRRKVRQRTRFREDVGGAVVLDAGVALTHGTPRGSTLELVDPRDGATLLRRALPERVSLLDGFRDQLMWSATAPDVVFAAHAGRVVGGSAGAPAVAAGTEASWTLESEEVIGLDPALASSVVACRARRVEIETFDDDPATGARRRLHAFVLEPRNPPPASQRLALIRSFYGGGNSYSTYDNILCAAGITVVSASVRGSSGFGKEFYGLNNRDLGGKEIVDLFEVARWTESRLGIEPARIGVYGRSHGGYATMRAMTFPDSFEGHARYPFGFGLAEAGFSDIIAFHDATNIPDWVVLEAGDPGDPEDRARLEDRSPLRHPERLEAPIFLLHGENDWRVPVAGSRDFAAAAAAADRSVTYVEVEGQGHSVKGVGRNVEAWQRRLDFLAEIVEASGGEASDGEASGGGAPDGGEP